MEIKERRPSITDAASSRRTSAKPRDGAEIAPKIRESAASPIWILWSERGGRGGGGGIRTGGTESPSRLAGGSGAPWLERARPNAATARRKSAIVSVSDNPGRRAPSAPQLDPPASARRTLGNLSPDNMKGTIDGSRPEPRRRVSTADQIKCSASDDVFLPTSARTAGLPQRRRASCSAPIQASKSGPRSNEPRRLRTLFAFPRDVTAPKPLVKATICMPCSRTRDGGA